MAATVVHVRNLDGTRRHRDAVTWNPNTRRLTVDDSYSQEDRALALTKLHDLIASVSVAGLSALVDRELSAHPLSSQRLD